MTDTNRLEELEKEVERLKAENEALKIDVADETKWANKYAVENADLSAKLEIAVNGLCKIMDGVVPIGKYANVKERMFAMRDIATDTLQKIKGTPYHE